MFGRMTPTRLVPVDAGKKLEVAVATLLATTGCPQIVRRIQFAAGVPLWRFQRRGLWSSRTVRCLYTPKKLGSASPVLRTCGNSMFLMKWKTRNIQGRMLRHVLRPPNALRVTPRAFDCHSERSLHRMVQGAAKNLQYCPASETFADIPQRCLRQPPNYPIV